MNAENKNIDFEMYKTLLDKYLQGNETDQVNEHIRQLFDPVIITAHDLIIGKIKSHEIDNKIYKLVTILSDYNKVYFSEIIPEDFKDEKYRRLKYVTLRDILFSLASS